MAQSYITAKKIGINNNCPECYSANLEMTFKQKKFENHFYKKISSDYIFEIVCTDCNTTIYPISWTDALERVIEYQKRAFIPVKSILKIKRKAWILLSAVCFLIASAILTFIFFIN